MRGLLTVSSNSSSVPLLLTAFAALAAVGVSVVTVVLTRRSTKDSTTIARQAATVEARATEFDIMDRTIDTLRENLAEAQAETDKLRRDLNAARQETRALRAEATAALANVAILTEHIREHVPEDVAFPRLRRSHG